MDITRINFSEAKYGATFDDLDVNKDGVINNDDANVAKDSKIKETILKAIADVDDEPELTPASDSVKASSAGKDKYGINKTDAANFDQDVTNSKGTVYVVMGNIPGCGFCTRLASAMQERLDELEAVANVYNMQWNENSSLCRSIYNQGGGGERATFPQIAKFVDGKFVELVDNPRDAAAAVEAMIKGATGTPGKADETDGTDEKAGTTTAKTEEDVKTAADDLKAKYPVGQATENYHKYSSADPSVIAFQKAMDDGFIKTLGDQGFSQTQIVDIVAQAFPDLGIANTTKGGYSCPKGTDDAAKTLFDKFVEDLKGVTGADVTKLREQVAALNVEITNNNSKLNKLKGTIENLKTEIEETITKAIEESEEIKEEQKKDAADIVKTELDTYANSNGDITYEEFQINVRTRLDALEGDGSGKLSGVIAKLMQAEGQMAVLENCITQFGVLVDANKELSAKVADLGKQIEEGGECEECEAQRCDPIGFEVDGTRYDFFVDKDENGDITNENEFLGAETGWAEMAALDKNNDGKVSGDEMQGLKMVATAADGTQTIKDASELFNDETDSIDLSSYTNVNQDFENGNTLLGSFTANIDGQAKDGYNTLDTLSWLDDNFEFTDEVAGINRFAEGNTETEEITDFSKELAQYQTDLETLNGKMDEAWNKVGITRADVSQNIVAASKKEATAKSQVIANKFATELKQEEKKAEAEEEAKKAEEEAKKTEEKKEEENKLPEDEA